MREELDTVVVEYDDETGIGHLTLNRPDSLNALSGQLRRDIVAGLETLEEVNQRADVVALRAVVMEGAGGNFCAGADITGFGEGGGAPGSARSHAEVIRDYPAPVIAKIEGYCLGGGLETAFACDFRFAHEDASIGLPEVDLGLLPGGGGVQYISRLANPSVAKEVAMTGEHLDAARAAELDIVNDVYADGEFEAAVEEFAQELASQPPLAVQAIKRSANIAVQTGLQEGRQFDSQAFGPLLGTDDAQKGMRAFADDDYEPEFEGK